MDASIIVRSLILLAVLLAGACNPIYKPPVQQGNVLDQDMIDQLRPNMSKRQVELVLGTSSLNSAFHADRWDYVWTLRIGRGEVQKRRLTVVFKDDKLVRLEGDWKPSAADVVSYKDKKTERAAQAAAEKLVAEQAAIEKARAEELASEEAAAKLNIPEREAAEYFSGEETAAEDIEAVQAGDESDDADPETGDD